MYLLRYIPNQTQHIGPNIMTFCLIDLLLISIYVYTIRLWLICKRSGG